MDSTVDEAGVSRTVETSEKIMVLWSKIEETSSLNIEGPLNPKEWDDLMFLLRYQDVSGIEHLRVSIGDLDVRWDVRSWSKLTGHSLGATGLGTVLGTGRFSALKRLEIVLGISHPDHNSPLRSGSWIGVNRISDRLDEVTNFNHIFESMVEGRIYQLTSLSIHSGEYRRCVAQNLDALLKSGSLRNLRHLSIGGKIFAEPEWTVLTNAIKSNLLPNLKSLELINLPFSLKHLPSLKQHLCLANLVQEAGEWFSSLENLAILHCDCASHQVGAMVRGIKELSNGESALKSLSLTSTPLDNLVLHGLADLVASCRFPQLEELDLSGTLLSSVEDLSDVFARLMDTVRRGRLPLLKTFDWRANGIGGAEAVAKAYFDNEALTADIHIDWDTVLDRSLVAKVKEFKSRNRRLVALRSQIEEEFKVPVPEQELKVLVPLSSAKIFLCGYPEVGKTTLRKTLGRHSGLRTRFMPERSPIRFKEPRTKGIELSRIQDKSHTTLILWDLAGQEEFHVLHGTFLANLGFAGGKATTFVLVFKVPFDANVEAKLMYWLKFVASSSVRSVKRHVMTVLNCFSGIKCPESDRRYWMGLIEDFAAKFLDILHIHPEPFIIDVRLAASVQQLKHHMFQHARTLLQDVQVPKPCFELLEDLKQWSGSEDKKRLPIFSWRAFEDGWKSKHTAKDDPPRNLNLCASYLHEIGEIIYLDDNTSTQPGSTRKKSIVVPDPEWFCKKVVGQLLLPKDMLEGGSSIHVSADGSISVIRFRAFFEHLLPEGTESDDVISMLEQLGLCFRKGSEEIVVTALIREDDYTSIDWEGKGFHGVMGRCLATEDKDRTAIPLTLFRRLQVELAQDPNLGCRGDSQYRAGKSFCSFKLGELLVLVQFDVDHSDPSDDRIDILVKSVLQEDSTALSMAKVNAICEIIQTLERLCVNCVPGLCYDVKVIQPFNAPQRTPKMTERHLMSLREIKARLINGQRYSSWNLDGDLVELNTLLSESELKEVLGSAEGEYNECKREAVALGLLAEDSLQSLQEFEQENGANAQGDVEGATTKYRIDDGADLSNILHEIRQQHHLTRRAVHEDGHLTRQYIEKSQEAIRQKQKVLVRHIQAQQEFSIEERERSVPRYIFLSKKQGKSNVWITLKQAFNESFELHFLCEAHFDDGFLHEVEGQEGISVTRPKWLSKISPWLRRSLLVVIMVARTAGNIYLPGVFNFIPDLNYLQNNGEGSSKVVDTAATMMQEEDEGVNRVQGDNRNYGTAGAPVDLRERMIAEGVVKDLIREIGEAAFKKKIGLSKVVLRVAAQSHIGGSTLAQSSEAQSCVRWICESCYKRYGNRARAIG